MTVVATGCVNEIFTEETANLDGSFTAGTGQITHFVFEKLTNSNFSFWNKYIQEMEKVSKSTAHGSAMSAAIKGFDNAMDNIDDATIHIAYSTLDLDAPKSDDETKKNNIQMCVTVSSHTTAPFFAVTHMGIFRSPLLADDPDKYGSLMSRKISVALHCFAARALSTVRPDYNCKLMITAPLVYMGGILSKHGAIDSFKKGDKGEPTKGQVIYSMKKGIIPSETRILYPDMGIDITLNMKQHKWLLMLAFNPQHTNPASFTNFSMLSNAYPNMQVALGSG